MHCWLLLGTIHISEPSAMFKDVKVQINAYTSNYLLNNHHFPLEYRSDLLYMNRAIHFPLGHQFNLTSQFSELLECMILIKVLEC